MRYLSAFFVAVAALLSCNSSEEKKVQEPAPQTITPEQANPTTCYTYAKDKDSVWLSLTIQGNAVNGRMYAAFFEKDKNEGSLTGELRGDTILANYVFASEGVTSARQVIFLKQDDFLIEGYGEMDPGGTAFKDISKVDFNNGLLLKSSNCPK